MLAGDLVVRGDIRPFDEVAVAKLFEKLFGECLLIHWQLIEPTNGVVTPPA